MLSLTHLQTRKGGANKYELHPLWAGKIMDDDNKQQLDSQGAWLMVREDLTGRLTNHEDFKYGKLRLVILF